MFTFSTHENANGIIENTLILEDDFMILNLSVSSNILIKLCIFLSVCLLIKFD